MALNKDGVEIGKALSFEELIEINARLKNTKSRFVEPVVEVTETVVGVEIVEEAPKKKAGRKPKVV